MLQILHLSLLVVSLLNLKFLSVVLELLSQSSQKTAVTIPQISHMMNACRMYYSQVSLPPQKALAYIEANSAKQVVYEIYLYNQYSNVSSQSHFSQLVQSGLRNLIGVAITNYQS